MKQCVERLLQSFRQTDTLLIYAMFSILYLIFSFSTYFCYCFTLYRVVKHIELNVWPWQDFVFLDTETLEPRDINNFYVQMVNFTKEPFINNSHFNEYRVFNLCHEKLRLVLQSK